MATAAHLLCRRLAQFRDRCLCAVDSCVVTESAVSVLRQRTKCSCHRAHRGTLTIVVRGLYFSSSVIFVLICFLVLVLVSPIIFWFWFRFSFAVFSRFSFSFASYFLSFSFVPEDVLMICLNTVHR